MGNSQGEHSKGELEHQEAIAALEFLQAWPGVNGERLGLAGYSFGNGVILGNAELQKLPRVFAFISPSLHVLKNTCLKDDDRPKFIITACWPGSSAGKGSGRFGQHYSPRWPPRLPKACDLLESTFRRS